MIQKLGFIGCGNMATAIIGGICGKLIDGCNVYAYDTNNEMLMEKALKYGFNAVSSIERLCETVDCVLVAVKPNIVEKALCSTGITLENKALISIAAGVGTDKLSKWLPDGTRYLRVMPNTPAMVGAGATALCEDTTTLSDDEKEWAYKLFNYVGTAVWIPERLIDAVVGVSGSGPAYVFMFIEAMADAGVKEGLSRAAAQKLAAQTVVGAGKMVLETGMHPGALKDMVCSPGGTTIDAVASLERDGMRGAIIEAVRVCAEKSRNL